MADSISSASPASGPHDDLWTVAAIAVLASIAANLAHETVGHGAGLLLAGGREGLFTTTRLIVPKQLPYPAWRIFDLGGPAGNLACAVLGWPGLRLLPEAWTRWRLFCWLAMSFSLFWVFPYMFFSGVAGRGDWLAVAPAGGWPARVLLAIAGALLFAASIRIAARSLGGLLEGTAGSLRARARRLVGISLLAGAAIAVAGPALDPRGAFEMLNSGALCSLGYALGLLWIPKRLRPEAAPAAAKSSRIAPSSAWIVAASIASLLFIAVLGPGIAWKI
jgi:hypothetical protein